MQHLMRFLILAAVLSSLPASAQAGLKSSWRNVKQAPTAPAKQDTTPKEQLRTVTDRKLDIRHIRLDLRVDVEKKTVVSQATVDFKAIRPAKNFSLDAMGFKINKVMLSKDGQPASEAQFTHDGKKLNIELGESMKAGQTGKVTIEYLVDKPRTGLHFFGPTKANPDIPLQVWSQGQTITNRYWIPCVDEPNQRQTSQVVVTVPAGFQAISNGRLVSTKENDDKTVTFDWLQDKPHPSYLITLVVGKFDVVEETWNGIPVLFYVPKGRKDEAVPTYGKTRDMMTYFSKKYGVQYPWDKYAQITAYQFGGGMENTSATTMGEGILKDERGLLDGTSDWIVSHELAHQWWGDLVTCRDWSHTWINEGSASYAEALWDEHRWGKDEYAFNMYNKANGAIAGGRARPVMDLRYTNPDAMFDSRSYPKGAWVLHMLRNRIGDDELFFSGLKQFLTDYRLQSVETADFRRNFERVSGRGLERFFYDWLERPGHPELEVTTEYKADEQKVHIVAKQTQTIEPFHFPLKIALYCKGASEPVIVDEEMKDRELKLSLAVPGALERVEVDPEHAVLAVVKEIKTPELWRAQLKQGTTVPVRMRALQQLRSSQKEEDKAALLEAYQKENFHGIKTQLASAVANVKTPAARDALLEALSNSDARVRASSVQQLGNLFKDDEKVIAAIRQIMQKGDASYGVEGAALRAYAKMGQKDTATILTTWLEKPGQNENLVRSALTALGEVADPASIDSIMTWTAAKNSRQTRIRAAMALQEIAKKKLDSTQQEKLAKSFESLLQEENSLLHSYAVNGLQQMGMSAKSALPALEKFASSQADGSVKETALKTIAAMKEKLKPAEPKEPENLDAARAEIKRLQKELDEIKKRVEKK